MLRQRPLIGFIILAMAVVVMAFMVVYVWLAWNALWALLVLLAAISVMVLVARWRRPATA